MRRLGLAFAVSLLLLLALGPGQASAAVACGVPVTQDDVVTGNLNCTGHGIVIGAPRITISFNDPSVINGDGDTGDVGILNPGYAGVTINGNNSTIQQFGKGVVLTSTRRNEFFNLNVTSSTSTNGGSVQLADSSGNTLFDLDADGNANQYGIMLFEGSNRNVIEDSAANNTTGTPGNGITLFDSSGNKLLDNDAFGNLGDGIFSDANSLRNLFELNDASNNGSGSTDDDGIQVNSATSRLTMNNADNNDGYGIHAVLGARDGGGNTATGNALTDTVDGDQCLGIMCTP